MTDSKVILGATTAAIAATSVLYSLAANRNKKNKPNGITILVFPDGGEQCSKTGGLEPNAIPLYGVQSDIKLASLQNLLAKELEIDMNKTQDIRLWVQVTKEEITDENTKSVLSNKQNGLLSTVVLICTHDRADLSSEAASSEPLGEFSYPSHVRDLSVLGLGHLLAYKRGPHELPQFNAYENLFRGRESKTLLVQRPPFAELYPELDYNPRKDFGDVVTVDPNMIDDLLSRQSDFPKMWTGAGELKIQEYTGLGLFTNSTTSESWNTGHGVLPRFFNALKIKNYYPLILGKTQSFIREWVAMGNHAKIEDANDWLTCMTADAVCKASMDVDMRNVERKGKGEELHPFIKSFRHCVAYTKGQEKDVARYEYENKVGKEFVKDLVERTRKGEIGGPLSFISGMLENTASTNGEYVSFDTFEGHCINIMIAGHETTAGTIAFTMAELARNPECMAKVVKEIEDVMGNRSSPTYADISKLVYVEACFRVSYTPTPPSRDNIIGICVLSRLTILIFCCCRYCIRRRRYDCMHPFQVQGVNVPTIPS
jgi:cytochrome P450